MTQCIFCQIAEHKFKADVVAENRECIAILDIEPLVPGHVLVFPKSHSVDFSMTEAIDLSKAILMVQEVGVLLKDRLGATGFNILSANGLTAQQSVGHAHFHVVPRFPGDGVNCWPSASIKNETVQSVVLNKLR